MPLPDDFWMDEAEMLIEILFPLFVKAGKRAARNGISQLEEQVGAQIGVDWTLVNEAVVAWAETYSAQVAAQFTTTSMNAFLAAFPDWAASGAPLQDLIDQLEPFYGEVRAEMVAVSEVTRAFAEGNVLGWGETGLVSGFDVMTAEDELVCDICKAYVEDSPFPLDDVIDRPPYHVRCRCWLRPVVSGQ